MRVVQGMVVAVAAAALLLQNINTLYYTLKVNKAQINRQPYIPNVGYTLYHRINPVNTSKIMQVKKYVKLLYTAWIKGISSPRLRQ